MSLVKHGGPLTSGSGVISVPSVSMDDGNPLLVPAPTVRASGDLLVGLFMSMSGGNTPSGWTFRNDDGGTTEFWTRTADNTSGDQASVAEAASAGVAVLRSPLTSRVWGVPANGAAGTITVPSVTAVATGVEIILVFVDSNNGGTPPGVTTPSGFVLLGTADLVDGSRHLRTSVLMRPVAGAGALGTTAVSYAGNATLIASGVKIAISA